MRLKEHVANQLAQALADRVQLGSKPTVIQAPPSQVADYPTIAVWIAKSVDDYSMAYTVIQDAQGNPIFGAGATSDDGEILDGDAFTLGDGTTLTSIGTLRCTGTIWVGSRYVGKREEVEWEITFAFNADDAAPGRLMLPLKGYQLGRHTVHFGFAAADLGEANWDGEKAFEARLWSSRPFTLDAPILIPRTDPVTRQLVLEISNNLNVAISEPADVTTLPDLEKYLHDADGNLVRTTI